MKHRMLPFTLTAAVVVADQISKALIVNNIPEGTVAARFFNDFLWICHVRNDAVAFSMGSGLPELVKIIVFIILPLIIIALLSYAVFTGKADRSELTEGERWCLAGIAGGGIGNLIDRIFRGMRVVDWISTDNYGWFGMERFPTYNIADAAVVVSVIILVLLVIISSIRRKDVKKD